LKWKLAPDGISWIRFSRDRRQPSAQFS